MDAAQLADDLRAQLELAQKKLHDFQDEIVENSVTKEKDMFNFKRAQVPGRQPFLGWLPWTISLCFPWL